MCVISICENDRSPIDPFWALLWRWPSSIDLDTWICTKIPGPRSQVLYIGSPKTLISQLPWIGKLSKLNSYGKGILLALILCEKRESRLSWKGKWNSSYTPNLNKLIVAGTCLWKIAIFYLWVRFLKHYLENYWCY